MLEENLELLNMQNIRALTMRRDLIKLLITTAVNNGYKRNDEPITEDKICNENNNSDIKYRAKMAMIMMLMAMLMAMLTVVGKVTLCPLLSIFFLSFSFSLNCLLLISNE